MYLHQIGSLGFSIQLDFIQTLSADEKSSFSKEDMKEGKHIEYARSLLKEMIQNSKSSEPPRCPTPHRAFTAEKSSNETAVNCFRDGNYDEVQANEDEDVDDTESEADLGLFYTLFCTECQLLVDFDPFHETQKGLAELLEKEAEAAEAECLVRRRPPPPPPGFEHLRSSFVRGS